MTITLAQRRDLAGWHRPLLLMTGAMTVLAVIAGIGVFVDPRTLLGAPVWLKPFKFAVSFAAYSATLAWMLSMLPSRSRVAAWAASAIAAVALAEQSIITFQAARGVRSHFNDTTPFDARLWQVMGMAIGVLFAGHLVIAAVVLSRRIANRTAATAIRLGLLLGLLGLLAAVPMVLPMSDPGIEGITGAHAVGVADGGPGVPVTGWSTTGGDLRIGHFVGLHGMQVLPLLALLLIRYGRRIDETTRIRLLWTAAAAYAVLVGLLTWQALRGQPLLEPDALTLAAWAALGLGTVAAVAKVLR